VKVIPNNPTMLSLVIRLRSLWWEKAHTLMRLTERLQVSYEKHNTEDGTIGGWFVILTEKE